MTRYEIHLIVYDGSPYAYTFKLDDSTDKKEANARARIWLADKQKFLKCDTFVKEIHT